MTAAGLCERCRNMRVVKTARGSIFLRCTAPEKPKYPRLPVLQCDAFVPRA